MATVQLFIGCNNTTGKLETDKIEAIVGKRHSGFTILPAVGHWEGSQEPTAVVLISDPDASSIYATAKELKEVLKQDAIGFQTLPDLLFV